MNARKPQAKSSAPRKTPGGKKLSAQDIYQQLRQMIMNFDLYPGSRVTEMELADHFKVSRTPVREALQRLEVEGHVQIRPKQGCFIRPVDVEHISHLYEVRVALEATAVELACGNMPRDELEELSEVWNPKNHSWDVNYPEQIKAVEEAFHVTIAEGGGNHALASYLRDVNDNIRIIRSLGFPDETSIVETYEEHFEICNLILQRKKAAARNAMIKHIRKSQEIARSVTFAQLETYRKKIIS